MRSTLSNASDNLWRRSYTPFTNTLLVSMATIFLLTFLRVPLYALLNCFLPAGWIQPWRIFTHPIVVTDIFGLLFTGLLLWWGGSSLERSWGTRTLVIFYASACLVAALAFTGIALLFGQNGIPAAGVFTAFLVAWCALNPDETIMIYGIVPVKARYLAVAACAIQFFTYGWNNPVIGLMSLAAPGLGVLWVLQGWSYRLAQSSTSAGSSMPRRPPLRKLHLRLVPSRAPKPKDDRFTLRDLNPFEFFAKRRRLKQFEKLMKDD